MVIYKLPAAKAPRVTRSPGPREHTFGITHHFEDGSKLLFAFISTGSCFSKLQPAGGPHAKGSSTFSAGQLRLRGASRAGPPHGPPPPCFPAGFAWTLNSTFSASEAFFLLKLSS